MSKYLVISSTTEMFRLSIDEVMCVTSDGNYSNIVLETGDEIVVTMQIGKVEELMHSQFGKTECPFVRIGKCIIVNWNYISYINPSQQILELSNRRGSKNRYTASRKSLSELKDFFDEMIKNR